MFTGIIEAVGRIASLEVRGGDARLCLDTGALDMTDVCNGDSIAVNGVCLTVVEFRSSSFCADVSGETLACTTLGGLLAGDAVNLEKALLASSRLGGHLVSGHVDGIGVVLELEAQARSMRLRIQAPAPLARYIAAKGSICMDGVSLTVNRIDGTVFEVNIVPHTAEATTLGAYSAGRRVNLEVDLIARYLERLVQGEDKDADTRKLSREFLAQHGFLK
mgnify:CR=1 FL=1